MSNKHLLFFFSLCSVLFSQDTAEIVQVETEPVVEQEVRSARSASITTRTQARTMTLTMPGPRGIITDRKGRVFANNRIVYHLSILFPELEDSSDEGILTWAREKVAKVAEIAGKPWEISDERLISHYRHRRWLPLQFRITFEEKSAARLKKKLPAGLEFFPFYMRNYPKQRSACHMIGYVRSKGKLPEGPITYGDPMWEETYGAEGFEKVFDKHLSGKPGLKKIVVDSDGTRLLDEYLERPQIGNTLVTTLDADWQKKAELALARRAKKGALVLLDIHTGEVLTMASYPTYDINVWIPRISQESFDKLRNDERAPMFARAFQARYPPASTFKPIVAAAAMTSKDVFPDTRINCPEKIKIGTKFFHNHSKYPAGPINVRTALQKSNNVYFYKVGLKTGPQTFLSAARQLGFGTKTDLPLFNETSGLVPTNEWMINKYGRPIVDGDTANLAIGQGSLAASPLQVAQSMAGIANGKELPRLKLVKQIQNYTGGVIEAPFHETRNKLTFSESALKNVRKGMYQVVNTKGGTGKRASVGFTTVVGKTGTAQWVANKELAWFTGFFPYRKPRFAYAVLYEGSKYEKVSGGQKAAPIISSFLNSISGDLIKYLRTSVKTEILEVPKVNNESSQSLRALPVEE